MSGRIVLVGGAVAVGIDLVGQQPGGLVVVPAGDIRCPICVPPGLHGRHPAVGVVLVVDGVGGAPDVGDPPLQVVGGIDRVRQGIRDAGSAARGGVVGVAGSVSGGIFREVHPSVGKVDRAVGPGARVHQARLPFEPVVEIAVFRAGRQRPGLEQAVAGHRGLGLGDAGAGQGLGHRLGKRVHGGLAGGDVAPGVHRFHPARFAGAPAAADLRAADGSCERVGGAVERVEEGGLPVEPVAARQDVFAPRFLDAVHRG